MIVFLFLLKTLIVGTREYRLSEAVLTSNHNLCFEAKIRKNVYPCKPQFYYVKVGCKGVCVTRTCFRDGIIWASMIKFISKYIHMVFYLSCNTFLLSNCRNFLKNVELVLFEFCHDPLCASATSFSQWNVEITWNATMQPIK